MRSLIHIGEFRFIATIAALVLVLALFDYLSFGKPKRPDPMDSIAGESLGYQLFSNNGVFGIYRVSIAKWTASESEPDRDLDSRFYAGVMNLTIIHVNHAGSHRAHREVRFSYLGVMGVCGIGLVISMLIKATRRLQWVSG